MEEKQCKHVKIINANSNKNEIELMIKILKSEFKDLNTSLKWKKILQNLQNVKMNLERNVHMAPRNEYDIIQKLYVQSTRLSPFELTDKYARTAYLWEQMRNGTYIWYKNIQDDKIMSFNEEESYNTDIDSKQSTENIIGIPNIDMTDLEGVNNTENLPDLIDLPNNAVDVNESEDKYRSPTVPNVSRVDDKSQNRSEIKNTGQSKSHNLSDLYNNDILKQIPETLIVKENNTKEKVFKIRILNIGTECRFIQFKDVSNSTNFQYIKLCPVILTKIYPGLSAVFRLTLKLKENVENILSGLWFRVFSNSNKQCFNTMFIPLVSDFIKKRSITVTENVYFPPVYSWQIKSKYGYPRGILNINVTGDFQYEVYIRKQHFNVINENLMNYYKLEVKDTESHLSEIEEIPKESVEDFSKESVEDIHLESLNVISLILDNAIERALDFFVMYKTYLRVAPNSKKDVMIFFTKADCPGYYQSLFNIEFYDSETKELIATKHVKVYAELLRHPIQIEPIILDMSHLDTTLGYCTDKFTLRNCHKWLTFIIRIETTKKMKKLFKITPIEARVSANSDIVFNISSCVQTDYSPEDMKERAFFTIKVNIRSNDQSFKDISAVFYEIIMPCAKEFKTIYHMDFNDDVESTINVNESVNSIIANAHEENKLAS